MNELMLPEAPASHVAPPASEGMAFTFGDPVPVLDRRELLDYLEAVLVGEWYEPPISLDGLAKTFRAAVHHSSPIYVKLNILASCFEPHPAFSRAAFEGFALDDLVFGNAYMERQRARSGRLLNLKPAKAKYVRRGKDLDQYFFVTGYEQDHKFPRGEVFHLMKPDLNQEIYGIPEYLSAIASALLNESATLFRRKYYLNGSHAGFILYMTDATQNQDDVDNLRTALKNAKGPGNFRNLFVYAPNGKKDGMQVIPVSEVAARDEFLAIKNVTRDDLLAAHRVPPQLMGIIPNNTGGFGDVEKAAQVFARNELEPLMNRYRQLNDWAGEEVVRFRPYSITPEAAPAAPVV
jgi:PBSX family phage portal protein